MNALSERLPANNALLEKAETSTASLSRLSIPSLYKREAFHRETPSREQPAFPGRLAWPGRERFGQGGDAWRRSGYVRRYGFNLLRWGSTAARGTAGSSQSQYIIV